MMAHSYLAIKDTSTACDFVNQFFTKATEEEIVGPDYILRASACGRNNPDIIRADIVKAVQIDSVLSRQVDMLDAAIADVKKAGHRLLVGELGLVRYQLFGEKANPAYLVPIGTDFYYGGQFQKADSLFQLYNKAFPDSIYGYIWSSRTNVQIDTAMALGLAVPAYEQTLRVAEMDKTRPLYKSSGANAAAYLFAYAYNVKKDKVAAKAYLDRGLAIDPENATLNSYKKAIEPRQGTATPPKNNSSASANDAKETKTKTATTKTKTEPAKTKTKPKG